MVLPCVLPSATGTCCLGTIFCQVLPRSTLTRSLGSLAAAYFLVAGNHIHDHGSTGFAAGQGTGFEFMEAPWLRYEAYDVKVRLQLAAAPSCSWRQHRSTGECPCKAASAAGVMVRVQPSHPALQLINNVIRDIQGAGFGLWGCYDCLFAHNTLLRVGARSHLVDIKFGERSCDGAGSAAALGAREGAALHFDCAVLPRDPWLGPASNDNVQPV